MPVSAPVYDKSDPKTDKPYAFHLPLTSEWSEHKDWFNQTAMTIAGAGIFIKHPLLVWISFTMAVIGFINQQPLRQSKDASNPIWTLGMAFAGILATNLPKMMLAPEVTTHVPVPPTTA